MMKVPFSNRKLGQNDRIAPHCCARNSSGVYVSSHIVQRRWGMQKRWSSWYTFNWWIITWCYGVGSGVISGPSIASIQTILQHFEKYQLRTNFVIQVVRVVHDFSLIAPHPHEWTFQASRSVSPLYYWKRKPCSYYRGRAYRCLPGDGWSSRDRKSIWSNEKGSFWSEGEYVQRYGSGTYWNEHEIEDSPNDIKLPANVGNTNRCNLYYYIVWDP